MNYQETLDFLYAQLPMYQRQGKSAFKKDLTNTFALCRALDKPELKFPSIHVAGTNGKGSVSHILTAIYRANGYKVGLYTSPHLVDFRERITVDSEPIGKDRVIDFVARMEEVIQEVQPSFFELTVAMAFDHFASEQVDLAIIETGLGGRLDSTNVIIPELAVITSIGMDHMDMLGDSLEEIAAEKAGIIKQQIPVVVGRVPEEAEEVIRSVAKERKSLFYDALRTPHRFTAQKAVHTDLRGAYQQLNIKTALIAIDVLQEQFPCSDDETHLALMNVASLSGLRGRWEFLSEEPLVLCDVGHNVQGLEMNLEQLGAMGQRIHFILGFVEGKDLDQIARLFPKDAIYSFVRPKVVRGMDARRMQRAFRKAGIKGKAHSDMQLALKEAVANYASNECGLIYIGGSNFAVADLLQLQESGALPF